MKAKNRDRLLIETIVAMRAATTDDQRYSLMTMGTALVTEYKDLKKEVIEQRIKTILDNPSSLVGK